MLKKMARTAFHTVWYGMLAATFVMAMIGIDNDLQCGIVIEAVCLVMTGITFLANGK